MGGSGKEPNPNQKAQSKAGFLTSGRPVWLAGLVGGDVVESTKDAAAAGDELVTGAAFHAEEALA